MPAEIAMMRNGPLHMELFEVEGAKSLPVERREPDSNCNLIEFVQGPKPQDVYAKLVLA